MSPTEIEELEDTYLDKSSPAAQLRAAEGLLALAKDQPQALAVLLNLFSSQTADNQAILLDRFVAFVPEMSNLLSDFSDWDALLLSSAVLDVLGKLGEKAQAAVPALIEHCQVAPRDEINVVALGRVGGLDAVRHLIGWTWFQTFETHDRKRTDAAHDALQEMGQRAVPDLLTLTRDTDPFVRATALLILQDPIG